MVFSFLARASINSRPACGRQGQPQNENPPQIGSHRHVRAFRREHQLVDLHALRSQGYFLQELLRVGVMNANRVVVARGGQELAVEP